MLGTLSALLIKDSTESDFSLQVLILTVTCTIAPEGNLISFSILAQYVRQCLRVFTCSSGKNTENSSLQNEQAYLKALNFRLMCEQFPPIPRHLLNDHMYH